MKMEKPEDEKMKNVLCEYFKQGNCPDGDKCKFAHDLNIEFNQGQVDIYTDLREAKAKLGIDYELMEQREAKRSKLPKTEIVCKFFLDAVKKKVYGYKWNCPNGDDCHYRHCLPKDYVIKTLKAQTEEEMTIEEFHDLEEKIDAERARLAENGTKVTEKTFQEWKEKKLKEKEKENNLTKDKKSELLKKLKTGRELFNTNKDEYKDDENADDDVYENQDNNLEDEDNKEKGFDKNLFKEEGNIDEVNFDDQDEEEEKENK